MDMGHGSCDDLLSDARCSLAIGEGMSIRTFARPTPIDLDDLADRVRAQFPSAAWSMIHREGAVEIDYEGDWGAINVPAVQADVDAVPIHTEARKTLRAIATDDMRFRVLVLWIAQLHGKTPAEAKAELLAILNGLT